MIEPSAGQQPNQSGKAQENSELFVALVVQLTQMALMALGRLRTSEDAQPPVNLEVGQFYIDTLEMLEQKTRGNLDPAEQDFLKRQLTTLRMCFVETVDSGVTSAESGKTTPGSAPESKQTASDRPAAAEDSKKRFVKKYGAEGGSVS